MFDFLSTLLQTVPSLISNFSGSAAPYKKQQQQLAQQQSNYAAALADPNSSIYQNIYNQNKQMGNKQLAGTVRELQGQNRTAQRMGRGFLDNERGGESIFRALMQGQQDVGNEAHQQTRENLKNSLTGGNMALGAYDNLTPYANAQEAQKLSGFDTLAQILKGYRNGNQGGYQPQLGWGGY